MAIFDRFRKKPKEEKVKKPAEKEERKPERVLSEKEIKPEKAPGPTEEKERKMAKDTTGLAFKVLKSPHITERATDLTGQRKYVFKVFPQANKIEVKKAIEGLYAVDVTKVAIVNTPSKSRRYGRTTGTKPGFKKAIITLKEGQKIDLEGV